MNSYLKRFSFSLTRNVPAKIIIFFLSICLWYFVNVLSAEKVTLDVPVRLDNTPEDLAIIPLDGLSVRVAVRSRINISGFSNQVKAFIDLSQIKMGEAFYRVRLEGVPDGVFYSIYPYSLRMAVDEFQEKSVPIALKTIGEDKDNYIKNPFWNPPSVTVKGPARIVRRLNEIESESINLKLLRTIPSNFTLKLNRPEFLTLSTDVAQLTADVVLKRFTNMVEVPLQLSNLPPHLKVKSDTFIKIKILSRISNMSRLQKSISVYSDASNLQKGHYKLPVIVSSFDEVITNFTPIAEISLVEF